MELQTRHDPELVDAFERQARSVLDDATLGGFCAQGWTSSDLAQAVLDRGEREEDIREVISTCCAIVKDRRSAGWASDLTISRETLDHAIRQTLGGRSVYARVERSPRRSMSPK